LFDLDNVDTVPYSAPYNYGFFGINQTIPQRFIAGVGSSNQPVTMVVTFPSLNAGGTLNFTATQDPNDGSVFSIYLPGYTNVGSAPASGHVTFTLTMGSESLDGTPKQPNFAKEKQFYSAAYPVHMARASGLLSRCEPILTPQLVVSRYLKGIPLAFPNGDHYTAADIQDQIVLATNEVEIACKITVSREQFVDKVPFDINLYRSFIYLKTEQGPVVSVQKVNIVSSDGYSIFEIPPEWIEPSNFSKGIINVVPILGAYSVATGGGVGAYGGIPYLSVFAQLSFIPGFWQLVYDCGVSKIEGQYPIVVNDLIGLNVAINMLSNIQTMFINISQSLSRDGISQSSSGPGPRMYQLYIEELIAKRDALQAKIKATFSQKFLISNI
jgi:hypothetical protein